MTEEHQPSTRTELILVEKMAQHYWTSQRAQSLQQPIFENGNAAQSFSLFLRYQTTHDRAFHKCLDQLVKLRAERRKEQIGFESQKRQQAAQEAIDASKQADETRRQEVHRGQSSPHQLESGSNRTRRQHQRNPRSEIPRLYRHPIHRHQAVSRNRHPGFRQLQDRQSRLNDGLSAPPWQSERVKRVASSNNQILPSIARVSHGAVTNRGL